MSLIDLCVQYSALNKCGTISEVGARWVFYNTESLH